MSLSISSWESLGSLCLWRKLSISPKLSSLLAWSDLWYFLITFLTSLMFPLSFLILIICAFFLVFLISLSRGLLILFISSKTKLLFSLISPFCFLLFYFIDFCYFLYYILIPDNFQTLITGILVCWKLSHSSRFLPSFSSVIILLVFHFE